VVDIIEGYETEEQQIQAIKGWWKKNGNALVIGAVVALGGLWGWRYYSDSAVSNQEEVSQAYSQMLVKYGAQTGVKDLTNIEAFAKTNGENSYGVLASLILVKEAVAQKNYQLAETQLLQLKSENSYQPFADIINLRLARVQAQLGKNDAALTTLNEITAASFVVKANQVKGAIYIVQGDLAKARAAFEYAINESNGRVDPVLQQQFDDLTLPAEEVASVPVLDVKS